MARVEKKLWKIALREFIRTGSKGRIFVDSYDERQDVAPLALHIGGNEAFFKSLSEIICYSLNELLDEVFISNLAFIESEITQPVAIQFVYGDQVLPLSNGRINQTDTGIRWLLTESEASVVATQLHGLGYACQHLHFDPIEKGSMAVHCFLENGH